MQLRLPAAIILFLGSYLPLSLILLAQDFDYSYLNKGVCSDFFKNNGTCVLPFQNPVYSIGIFVACLVCFTFSLLVLRLVPAKREIVFKEATYVPAELMNYTLPYVVSFMSISYQETGKFIGLLIFLLWMFWITYRSGQIILNPILIAFGWRLYSVKYRFAGDDVERDGIALVDGLVSPGERHKYSAVQDVLIVRSINQKG